MSLQSNLFQLENLVINIETHTLKMNSHFENANTTSVAEIKNSLFQSNVSKEEIWDKICDLTYVINYLVKNQMNALRLYPDPNMPEEDLKYRLFQISKYALSEKEYSNAWQNLMK